MDRNEEWRRLIDEYREVPVPPQIRDVIQDAVVRGKKRAAKRRRTAYISTAVSGAAAVILILVLLPNLNAQMADRMGRAPVIGGFFKAVTVRHHEGGQTESAPDDDGRLLTSDAAFDTGEISGDHEYNNAPEPQSAGGESDFTEGGEAPEPASARDVQEDSDGGGIAAYSGEEEIISMREANPDTNGYTQRLVEHFEAENERDGGRLVLTGYEVVTDSDEWLTLIIYANESADTNSEQRIYYNVDKTQNALMTLGELYNGRDYVGIISEEILCQLEAEKTEATADDADMQAAADLGSESVFTQIHENQNYYFNADGNLVIVLDGNQISADMEEHTEFVIDVTLLE